MDLMALFIIGTGIGNPAVSTVNIKSCVISTTVFMIFHDMLNLCRLAI